MSIVVVVILTLLKNSNKINMKIGIEVCDGVWWTLSFIIIPFVIFLIYRIIIKFHDETVYK